GNEIFGQRANERNVGALLYVQDSWFNGADWFTPALFLRPGELKRRAEREQWSGEKMQGYLNRVERLREIAKQYGSSDLAAEKEMARIAALVVRKWDGL